nr:MAG TPA: hypothetical protein [Caudoviricetes sp.]
MSANRLRKLARHPVAQLLGLWIATTMAMAALFCVYDAAQAKSSPIKPTAHRKLT